jgi:hypothetical protein
MMLTVTQVVPDDSSRFPNSDGAFMIDANHIMMCKFSSKEDVGYERVRNTLQGLCQGVQVDVERAAKLAYDQRLEDEKAVKAEQEAQRQ